MPIHGARSETTDLDDQRVLKQVSFNVERGEWVVLLGANGSGKSTLAQLANGLLLPSAGEVTADGVSSHQTEKQLALRKLVGLVTQDPDNQIVSTTVFDEVAFGPQNLSWEPERIHAAVKDALAQVGLPEEEFSKRDPNSLSGGEKQRVVIAALLAMQPNYLVLDEPTSMLDPVARSQVNQAISLAAASGIGILYITHRLEEALLANKVLVLDRGELCFSGVPEDILKDRDALIRHGLLAEVSPRVPAQTSAHKGSREQTTLELRDVSFSYPDTPSNKPIIQNFSLILRGGQCLLLVGVSGCGKSTLLTLAAGLMRPDSGEVLLQGKAPLAGQVGLVFQQPETQLFAQTLEDDILFGPKNMKKLSAQTAAALVDEVLSAVGLNPTLFKDRSPFSLSGGEARRAAIATILALETDFLLFDEPTAGLDARGRVFLYELIEDLLAKGKGIIIATHDADFFADLATGKRQL